MKQFRISFIYIIILVTLIHGCIRDEVLLPPVITSFDKDPVSSASILKIAGKYFDPTSTRIFINDTVVTNAIAVALTEISLPLSVRKSKTDVFIHVETKYGKSEKKKLTILPPAPSVTRVIPNKAGAGKKVKVLGEFISNVTLVQFKSPDQAATISAKFTQINSDTVEVTIPSGLSKYAADLVLTTLSGVSQPAAFTVLSPPVITSFSPDQAVRGSIVQLIGKELGSVLSASVGNKQGEILTLTSELIEIRVPLEAVNDTIYVSGTGGNAKSSKKLLIVPPPLITTVDKLTGDAGADITITGLNFSGAFEVKFGSTSAQIISNTGLVIKTKVPLGASSGKISVTTLAGTALSPQDFVVLGSPLISSFSPASGLVGTKIILQGINLLTVTSAQIGLVNLKINSQTDTQMEVEVLAGTVTGKISVKSTGSTFATTDNFIVTGTPQISSFIPTSGTPGTIVTITGINFPSTPIVKFGTSGAASVSKVTATEIICQVPSDATTGKVNVSGALSTTDFMLIAKAIIASITPAQGGIDKEVTITGQYLTGAVIKFFNNITATKVGTGTDTQVVVKVPGGATTGKINITTSAGITTSVNDFQVLPAPAISSFTPTGGSVGTSITISGTNLQYNPEVRFFNNLVGSIKSIAANQIVVDVPVGATTGKISVKTDAVVNAISSPTDFVVLGKPTITAIAPASGTINEKVIITGTNLTNALSVSFDGVTTSTFISSSATSIEVRVPASVNGTTSRSINVNVKTVVDNSNNQTFSLLGTPVISKLSPNNNPAAWAFLIEGTNLNAVKKLSLDSKIPTIGVNGIDLKAFNYITTKVPDDLKPLTNQSKVLKLFYTSDDVGFIETTYQVLSVPPPGVFPPPFIILPPPLPVNFVQNDISAYWENPHFVSVTGDTVHCFNIRGNFRDAADLANQTGSFCQFQEYYGINGVSSSIRSWGGTWNKGVLQLTSGSLTMTGQVSGSTLIFTDNNGRQLQLKFDSTGGCGIINSNGCENND